MRTTVCRSRKQGRCVKEIGMIRLSRKEVIRCREGLSGNGREMDRKGEYGLRMQPLRVHRRLARSHKVFSDECSANDFQRVTRYCVEVGLWVRRAASGALRRRLSTNRLSLFQRGFHACNSGIHGSTEFAYRTKLSHIRFSWISPRLINGITCNPSSQSDLCVTERSRTSIVRQRRPRTVRSSVWRLLDFRRAARAPPAKIEIANAKSYSVEERSCRANRLRRLS